MHKIVGWSGDHPLVEAWSDTRLPFEPTGEMLALRSELREALATFPAGSGPDLAAEYHSASADRCDAENILFSNVGSGAFAGLGITSLRLRRVSPEPPLAPDGTRYAHYLRYAAGPAPVAAPTGGASAVFMSEDLRNIGALSNAWSVWYAMKAGRGARQLPGELSGLIGLSLTVSVPSIRPVRPVTIVKAVLDGVVAAFHAHDGSDLENVAAAVAAKIGRSDIPVGELLQDDANALLGRRRLVWLFRGAGVQMNPAHDQITFAELRVRDSVDGKVRISGELFAAPETP